MSIVVLLLLICYPLFLLGIVALIVARWYSRTKAEILNTVRGFLASPGDGQPSEFAKTIQAISQIAAGEIKSSITGSLMGSASAVSKAIQGMESDVAGDMLAAKNPLVAALIDFSPSLKKRISKSPMAAMALSQLNFGSLLGGTSGGSNLPENNHKSADSFGLKI